MPFCKVHDMSHWIPSEEHDSFRASACWLHFLTISITCIELPITLPDKESYRLANMRTLTLTAYSRSIQVTLSWLTENKNDQVRVAIKERSTAMGGGSSQPDFFCHIPLFIFCLTILHLWDNSDSAFIDCILQNFCHDMCYVKVMPMDGDVSLGFLQLRCSPGSHCNCIWLNESWLHHRIMAPIAILVSMVAALLDVHVRSCTMSGTPYENTFKAHEFGPCEYFARASVWALVRRHVTLYMWSSRGTFQWWTGMAHWHNELVISTLIIVECYDLKRLKNMNDVRDSCFPLLDIQAIGPTLPFQCISNNLPILRSPLMNKWLRSDHLPHQWNFALFIW